MTARRCGECTLCCKLLPVRELSKPANMRCRHQSTKGCAVYHRAGFPVSCALWSCRWLVDDDTADQLRPDRSGYVIDIMPDSVRIETDGEAGEIEVIQVWVEPGRDVTNNKRLRRYAERQAERGAALLLRHGTEQHGILIFAPSLASDGEWHVVDDERVRVEQTATGNRILDRLKGEADDLGSAPPELSPVHARHHP